MAGLLSLPVKALGVAQKFPVAAVGLAGTGVAINEGLDQAAAIEQDIRNNYTGAPMGHYVYAELEQFEERKGYLDEKLAFEKEAVVFEGETSEPRWTADQAHHNIGGKGNIAWGATLGGDLSQGFGKAIGQETIGGLSSLLGSVADSLRDKIVLMPKREAIFEHLVKHDPVISQYEASQPGSAARAFMTMSRFAPELSTDPNVVTSFLREAAQTGGTMNHVMIKQLAEAEAAIQAAKGGGRR